MLSQERFLALHVPFPDLAEHPPHCLVYQVLFVREQQLRDPQGFDKPPLLYEVKSRQNGDAAFPETARFGEIVQRLFAPLEQVSPYYLGRGEIHEVPVIYVRRIGHVQFVYPCPYRFISPRKGRDKEKESKQSFLMKRRPQKRQDFRGAQVLILLRNRPESWNGNAEENVSFPVLARPRFEKSFQEPGFFFIAELLQACMNLFDNGSFHKVHPPCRYRFDERMHTKKGSRAPS